MAASWKIDEHRAFIKGRLGEYNRSVEHGTLGKFWPKISEEWFGLWPLSEPPQAFIDERGTEKAWKGWKAKHLEVSSLREHLVLAQAYHVTGLFPGLGSISLPARRTRTSPPFVSIGLGELQRG